MPLRRGMHALVKESVTYALKRVRGIFYDMSSMNVRGMFHSLMSAKKRV